MCDFGFKTPFQGLQFLLGQSHVMFWSSAHACNELGVKCVLPADGASLYGVSICGSRKDYYYYKVHCRVQTTNSCAAAP